MAPRRAATQKPGFMSIEYALEPEGRTGIRRGERKMAGLDGGAQPIHLEARDLMRRDAGSGASTRLTGGRFLFKTSEGGGEWRPPNGRGT